MNNKTKLFIDFDDTLFDRNRFRKDLLSIVKKFGFSGEEIEKSYKAVYSDGYDGIVAQLEYLKKHIRDFDIKSAKKDAEELLNNTSKYLFPETLPFLESIDRDKFLVSLLTVGGIDFQKSKVSGAKIKSFFNKCFYTTNEKAVALNDLVEKGEKFILLEDKDREIENVLKNFPNASAVKVSGGHLKGLLKKLGLGETK